MIVFRKGLLACCLVWACPVCAETVTGSVAALAVVDANCRMSGGSLNFGAYDPLVTNASAPLDGEGSFSITCAKGTTAVISISPGENSAHAVGTSRAMSSGSAYLSYDLFTAANRSTVWSTLNTVTYLSTSKNATNTLSVWGRIPPGQNVPGGVTYSDVVTVTAAF